MERGGGGVGEGWRGGEGVLVKGGEKKREFMGSEERRERFMGREQGKREFMEKQDKGAKVVKVELD